MKHDIKFHGAPGIHTHTSHKINSLRANEQRNNNPKIYGQSWAILEGNDSLRTHTHKNTKLPSTQKKWNETKKCIHSNCTWSPRCTVLFFNECEEIRKPIFGIHVKRGKPQKKTIIEQCKQTDKRTNEKKVRKKTAKLVRNVRRKKIGKEEKNQLLSRH